MVLSGKELSGKQEVLQLQEDQFDKKFSKRFKTIRSVCSNFRSLAPHERLIEEVRLLELKLISWRIFAKSYDLRNEAKFR